MRPGRRRAAGAGRGTSARGPTRAGCLHDVGDPCRRRRHRIKEVRVAPPQRQRHELVHELARRLVPPCCTTQRDPPGRQRGLPSRSDEASSRTRIGCQGSARRGSAPGGSCPANASSTVFDDAGITESHMSLHTRHAAEGIGMFGLAGLSRMGKDVPQSCGGEPAHAHAACRPARAGHHPDNTEPAREAQRHECGADRLAPRSAPRGIAADPSMPRGAPHRVPEGVLRGSRPRGATGTPPAPTASVGSRPASPPRRTSRRSFPGGSLPQPVVAAVNGPAAGGGLTFALASDIRIASSSARFNVAFVRLGLSGCDIGVSWLLPRLVGGRGPGS